MELVTNTPLVTPVLHSLQQKHCFHLVPFPQCPSCPNIDFPAGWASAFPGQHALAYTCTCGGVVWPRVVFSYWILLL